MTHHKQQVVEFLRSFETAGAQPQRARTRTKRRAGCCAFAANVRRADLA
jgi:hypothetical protein